MVNINNISTEKRNSRTTNMDVAVTEELLKLLNDEDKLVPYAVEKAIPQIAKVVDVVAKKLENGGRLLYIGAGTSGRIGVLDASECPPTFGVEDGVIVGIIAGGDYALRNAVEGVEDSKEEAINDLKRHNLSDKDFLIGIAASGRTPYVVGGLEYANSINCETACVTTSSDSIVSKIVKYPIEAITGAEPLTGSTRMKSGTAQKLILNMISTAVMVKLGKVYENLMIDVQMSNDKLVSRAERIVMEVTGVCQETAAKYLKKFNSVKYAVFSILTEVEDLDRIEKILKENKNNVRESIKKYQKG
ncbi:N-acetylmuramic acid 6-phosphate etherase [Acholeplasma sp. OttesenSCG-928-E16]|nr:N-acetylmuramic acid 6-phosphate etherase [Acholeplasma sp. OttesenSCG-928-E16]